MRDRIRETLQAAGLLNSVRQLAERGRVLRRLLRATPPIPVHRNEDIEPFFIVGSGRCGTTLLRRILMAGDEVHIPPENWHLGSTMLRFRQRRWSLEWEEIIRLAVVRVAHQGTGADGTVKRWFVDDALDPIIKELAALPISERSLARLFDVLYRRHGQEQDATFTRWADKTPLNVNWMPVTLKVFPKARFIHMLRDGTDVISSWLKMNGFTLKGRALRWKSAVRTARQFSEAHPQRLLEVRYEDLVREPETTVRHICSFLKLDFTPAMMESLAPEEEMDQINDLAHHENVFEPVTSSYIGKGHRNLEQEQKEQIADLIGDELQACGYRAPA